MQLTYRGFTYQAQRSKAAHTTHELSGIYRGTQGYGHTQAIATDTPSATLRYRGLAYPTCALIESGLSNRSIGAVTELWAGPIG